MKKLFRITLRIYLKFFAKLALAIHRPQIIVIAGSTDKSFYKEEISSLLRAKGIDVRSNIKSYNTEIGLPLAILNLPSGYGVFKDWLPAVKRALFSALASDFPGVLVLELGVSDPQDMRYLLSIARPDIAVLTNITQRYLESFSGMDELAEEYSYLAGRIKPGGKLLYNIDNTRIQEAARSAKVEKVSFGMSSDADFKIIEVKKDELGSQVAKLRYNGEPKETIIKRPGIHHVYARMAGLIIANSFNIS